MKSVSLLAQIIHFSISHKFEVSMVNSESAKAPRIELNWAASKTIGGISEIAVLSPIKKGCVPGERRSYEERLAFAIDNLADRHRQGLPTELSRIPSIHFGRMIIIR